MFENVLHQPAAALLEQNILKNVLPNSLLFSGPAASGKLTAALELARVLGCRNSPKGSWTCECPSCARHKVLAAADVLITGSRNCSLEIAAAKKSLIAAVSANASYHFAARYFFIRSVRKLTARFNPVLWEDDDKAGKAVPFVSAIDELLEELDVSRPLPQAAALEKLCTSIMTQCGKLESACMYDALPVSQIRRASMWAHYSAADGKKVLIIENADRMQDSARNALLKILEEPPDDAVFVLTTARRSAIISTILSRVRTYAFYERTAAEQREVVERVFHESGDSVEACLLGSLPVDPESVKKNAALFWREISAGHPVDAAAIVKALNNFEPRMLLPLFFKMLLENSRALLRNGAPASAVPRLHEQLSAAAKEIQNAYDAVFVFNITPLSALERLAARLFRIMHG
ncbi:MAG: hypothetical protein NC041_08415 [Bacteroides sp.]|nr:hypothetical protein [Prevotella sp.]MCM1408294.1 DNA polymerase III [Treponema brennaborense]MCM1470474.1 hypothetical protein [Bacteroides sp.]